MKVNLEPNYIVSVRSQVKEHEPDTASCYEGIFTLTLNQFVDITFMPMLAANIPRQLNLPDNFDDITSAEEAAWTMLFLSDYIVVPDDKRAGDAWRVEAALNNADDAKLDCTFFVVSAKQFAQFVQELEAVAAQQRSVYDFVRHADVARLEVFRYLENIVFKTTMIHEKHLGILKKPYAQLIRRCVVQVEAHNRTQRPLIYHGYFDRLQTPEIYVNGFSSWEHVAVGMRKRFVPDKRRLLLSDAYTFWRIERSAIIPEDDPNWQDHLIRGVDIRRDRENADLFHVDMFRQWRWLDDWSPFLASPNLVEVRDETNESERVTFSLTEMNNDTFAARLIAYVDGQAGTI